MRYALLFVCLTMLSASKVWAQDEEAALTTLPSFSIIQSVPSEEVQNRIQTYIQSTGATVIEHFPHMVSPRVCRQRDFIINEDVPHPRAGLVLRIEDGECVTGRPYFVHDPKRHRIWPITEAEALAILEAMLPVTTSSAPE